MSATNQVYLIDAGNTHIKLALVQNGVIQQVERLEQAKFNINLLNRNIPAACSSVLDEKLLLDIRTYFSQVLEITSHMDLPFEMAYQTPQTLGMDRLCNAAALAMKNTGVPRLAIDLGTCIKFDFLSAHNQYLGGSIAPGLAMRARAMAQFTSKLKQIDVVPTQKLIGSSSEESLQIGAFVGWQREIEGMIQAYLQQYPDLVVYLTGGDAPYFELGQKNGIFVQQNLTLEGIFALYQANA